MPVGDGNVSYEGILTIVPLVTIGATRLESGPFPWLCLTHAAKMAWHYGHRSDAEGGDPGGGMRAVRARPGSRLRRRIGQVRPTCVLGFGYLLTEVALNGKGKAILFLDTGNNGTRFFPRFAIRNLDLVSANGRQTVEQWHAQGAHGERREVTLPEITLSFGGVDETLRPVLVELEKPSVNDRLDGTIGMDFL